jgi:hypothetical protein
VANDIADFKQAAMEKRRQEAERIRARFRQDNVRLSMFHLEEAILLLHVFKEGETIAPDEVQLKRLQELEKKFFEG